MLEGSRGRSATGMVRAPGVPSGDRDEHPRLRGVCDRAARTPSTSHPRARGRQRGALREGILNPRAGSRTRKLARTIGDRHGRSGSGRARAYFCSTSFPNSKDFFPLPARAGL